MRNRPKWSPLTAMYPSRAVSTHVHNARPRDERDKLGLGGSWCGSYPLVVSRRARSEDFFFDESTYESFLRGHRAFGAMTPLRVWLSFILHQRASLANPASCGSPYLLCWWLMGISGHIASCGWVSGSSQVDDCHRRAKVVKMSRWRRG